jgi:general secretion pathway protein N
MPGKRSWLALGCGAYLALVCTQFPAAVAYRWFAPETLHLAGISGTLWSGRADLASFAGLPMRELQWNIAAVPLLLGRLSVELSARLITDGFLNASASASMRSLRLTGVRAATSLDTLATLLPLHGARGLVSIDLDELQLDEGWPTSVVGTLRLRELQVPPLISNAASGSGLVPLGDYELSNVELSAQRIAARLRDTGGPLEVQGTVALALRAPATLAGASPTFDGLVRERPGLPEPLREPLEFLTLDVDANGWRRLDLDPWLSSL